VYAVDFFSVIRDAGFDYSVHLDPGTQEYLSVFLKNIREAGLDAIVTPIKSSAVKAARSWTGPPVYLIFIDANHAYSAVRSDFLEWVRHCDLGARVVFHDYRNCAFPGVRHFVDRLIVSGILRNAEVVDSILLGTLAVKGLGSVKRRLALCPVWLPPSLGLMTKVRRKASRVLKQGLNLIWQNSTNAKVKPPCQEIARDGRCAD